ncbi:MAG: 2-hydroxyacyl-CoA dehydratase subunit D [Chloroflexota bacterium]
MADDLQVHRGVHQMLKEADDPEFRLLVRWLEGVLQAVDEGRPIVYHPFTTYSEVMLAMDLQPLCCEAWDLVGVRVDEDHTIRSIDAAHEAGIPDALCSYDKAIIGSVLRGTVPPPSLIAVAAMPCQSAYITYQAVAELTGAPLYVCDIPYYLDEEGALDHWVNQYRGLIAFLEERTGRKMDYDRLREVVDESNRCVELWLEAFELQKRKPAPWSGPLRQGTTALMMAFGSPEGTEAVQALLARIKETAFKGEGALPEEKARLAWFHFMPGWDRQLMDFIAELGVAVPYVLFDDFRVEPVDTSTVEGMIRGMAQRALRSPMGKLGRGAFDEYIEDLVYVAREWKADCVAIGAHPGCKWITGACGLIRDACREHGIPLLVYDLDLVDRRVTSAEESRTRLEQFLTTVIDR